VSCLWVPSSVATSGQSLALLVGVPVGIGVPGLALAGGALVAWRARRVHQKKTKSPASVRQSIGGRVTLD
jgi:hypothetical protein